MCRCKPVGITRAKGSRLYFAIGYVNLELRNIKRHLKYQLSFMMNLYMLFNVIQLSVRNEITSIVFQGQSYLLQVILS